MVEKTPSLIPTESAVLVGGCFDVLHYGHIRFLEEAKKLGKKLVVLLESDEFIRRNKKREPVHNQNQRAEILAALHSVDLVVLIPLLQNDDAYFHVVEVLRPAVIAVTAGDKLLSVKQKQAAAVGGIVKEALNPLPEFSSSRIITHGTHTRN